MLADVVDLLARLHDREVDAAFLEGWQASALTQWMAGILASADADEALARAIRDHGAGNWLAIREDRRYNAEYCDRTTVQLKDKYRTLCQQGRF